MVIARTSLLVACGLAAIASRLCAAEPTRFGDRPARYSAVVQLDKVLREHERFRSSEYRRKQIDAKEATRIETLKQDLRRWSIWAKQLRGGAEDDLAARALRDVIAEKQFDISAAEALAKIDAQRRARENLSQALDEIDDEIARFARKHDIALVVRTEQDWDSATQPSPAFDGWNCITLFQDRHSPVEPITPLAARALFEREVVYHNNIDISYDIIDALRRR